MYCKDCSEPTCVLCVTTTHNKHNIGIIQEFVENGKQQKHDDVEILTLIDRIPVNLFSFGTGIQEFVENEKQQKHQDIKIFTLLYRILVNLFSFVSEKEDYSEEDIHEYINSFFLTCVTKTKKKDEFKKKNEETLPLSGKDLIFQKIYSSGKLHSEFKNHQISNFIKVSMLFVYLNA